MKTNLCIRRRVGGVVSVVPIHFDVGDDIQDYWERTMRMELSTTAKSSPRPARLLFAILLVVVAIVSFRREKRLIALVSGVGAAALGYTAIAGSSAFDDEGETDATATEADTTDTTATDSNEMRCASCDEPIVVGQSRRPNPNSEIVHEACLDVSA